MDTIQKQHELAIGDAFITQFNQQQGTQYVFHRRGNKAPDLVYRHGDLKLQLEIVTCYYDTNDAKTKWQIARNLPNAPTGWSGVDFDQALVANINAKIHDKCAKDYGPNCMLIVYISPNLTTFKEMEALLPRIEIPSKHGFAGIYLVGNFGISSESTVSYAIRTLTPVSG